MSILRGQFAVAADRQPARTPRRREAVVDRLARGADGSGPGGDHDQPVGDPGVEGARPSHVIRVHGADHPGIVHSVASALAERGGDIRSARRGSPARADARIYVMVHGGRARGRRRAEVEATLGEVARRAGVESAFSPLESEAL